MLVLSRGPEDSVIINGNIVVKVLEVRNGRVRFGIEAPKTVPIKRGELKGDEDGDDN